MSNSLRHTLVVASVAALTLWGSTAVASADTGNGNGSTPAHSTTHTTPAGQHKAHAKPHGKSVHHHTSATHGQHKGTTKPHGHSGAHGTATAPGQINKAAGGAAAPADPPGNNGTIKITPLGEQDGTPNNSPHTTCGFQIEWYGFDQGNYYSQVSFAMQAPTSDATITPNGPLSVFVGGDPASGAGTATGLDARESYYPTFTGTPHPKQGFHVKVTVATPFSHGNDTKSKVFWVEPCATTPTPVPPGGDTPGGDTPGVNTPGVDAPGAVEGTTTVDAPGITGVRARATVAGVPTAVDAGQGGQSILDRVRSPLPLLLMAGALAGIALWWSRRRAHVAD